MSLYDSFPAEPVTERAPLADRLAHVSLAAGSIALLTAGAENDAGLQPDIIGVTTLAALAAVAAGLVVKGYRSLRSRSG